MFLYPNQKNIVHKIIVTYTVKILSYFKMWKETSVNYSHISTLAHNGLEVISKTLP